MGGGPGTALHRSVDGGRSWEKLTEGLPEGRMGKIGLAISPQDPDVGQPMRSNWWGEA